MEPQGLLLPVCVLHCRPVESGVYLERSKVGRDSTTLRLQVASSLPAFGTSDRAVPQSIYHLRLSGSKPAAHPTR